MSNTGAASSTSYVICRRQRHFLLRLIVEDLRPDRDVEELDDAASAIGRPALNTPTFDFQSCNVLGVGMKDG